MGNEVHVVCGQPNSPSISEGYVASGIQQRRGVTIHRLRHTQFAKRIPAGRIINLLSFTQSASRYLKRNCPAVDVVVSETDPFLLPIVGAEVAQRTGARFIAYLQDIYPDVAEAIGKAKSGVLTKSIRRRLKSAYDGADGIIVLGECMKERLCTRDWSVDANKVQIIPNWADCNAIVPIDPVDNPLRRQWKVDDKFVVMHSGNMGLTQQLDVLIRAIAEPTWPDHAVLCLIGDGAERTRLQTMVEALPISVRIRVIFLNYQSRDRLSESLSAADLHIVSMHPAITGCLCPSKLYGILAAGRPVLAIADPATDLVRLVVEKDVGWAVEPNQPSLIARKVAEAASQRSAGDRSARARRLAESTFSRCVILDQLTNWLSRTSSLTPTLDNPGLVNYPAAPRR